MNGKVRDIRLKKNKQEKKGRALATDYTDLKTQR